LYVGFFVQFLSTKEGDNKSDAAFALLHLYERVGASSLPICGKNFDRKLLCWWRRKKVWLFLLKRMPMVIQRDRCGPVVVSCRWLLGLNMRWSSSAMVAGKRVAGGPLRRWRREKAVAGGERWLRLRCVVAATGEYLRSNVVLQRSPPSTFCFSLLFPGC
jgi:hypothetical protein